MTLQTRFVVTFTVCRAAHRVIVSLHFNARENAVFPVLSFPDIPVLSQKLNGFTIRRDIALGKRLIVSWHEVLHVMRAEGRVWCTSLFPQESPNRTDLVFVYSPPPPSHSLCFVPWHSLEETRGFGLESSLFCLTGVSAKMHLWFSQQLIC